MTEDPEFIVKSDSVQKNVLVNSISQVVAVVAGLLSSSLLVRSIDISWTISDYAHLKVLTYWDGLFSIVIMLGLTTGVIKSISESAHDREALGSVIGVSLISVTAAFLAIAFVSVLLAEQIGFLAGETIETTIELRAFWILVLLSLLPGAYYSIAGAVFVGLQRMNRTLYVNLAYNGSSSIILVILFLNNMIAVREVLYMYLGTTILAFIVSTFLLRRELKTEGISLSIKGWREISGPLFRVSSVILALALLATFGNIIAPLIVNYVGTDTDLARYAIAQRSIDTIKSFLYAPFAIILPNMAGMRARGEDLRFRTRFEEAYRIIIPALIFMFLAAFAFGPDILGAVYGVRALDATGGLSAANFFVVMSPILLIIPITTLYGQLILASDKMRVLLVFGVVIIALQSIWTILMQPLFGILAIPFWWVVFFPVFIGYHVYCKRTLKVHIRGSYLARALLLCGLFGSIMIGMSFLAGFVVNGLSFSPLMKYMTIKSIAKLLFIIPLWYVFLAFCLILGLMRVQDLDNLKRFLKQVPPLWWISRPILRIIERATTKKGNGL
jgi:O-antigen/teichoic acid export membrane protein